MPSPASPRCRRCKKQPQLPWHIWCRACYGGYRRARRAAIRAAHPTEYAYAKAWNALRMKLQRGTLIQRPCWSCRRVGRVFVTATKPLAFCFVCTSCRLARYPDRDYTGAPLRIVRADDHHAV